MKTESWLARLLIKANVRTGRRASLAASPVTDRNVTQGIDWNGVYRDRYNYDREQIYDQALIAWRLNPLARRIIEIQGQYTIDGIDFACSDEGTQKFLTEFWNHPLNRIGEHLREWADELALTGNLFPLLTTDAAGMSYLRIHPTDMIADIITAPNDIQQERAYTPKPTAAVPDPADFPNYFALKSRKATPPTGGAKTVMLHYSVNKLAGMLWGEPDIAPLLPWLARYASWLEDRVRLNRFRQAYLYIVKGKYASQAEKDARQAALQNNPPMPGTILVANEGEEWDVINPKLDSSDANTDGLALKKFIAGGRGFPLHWLAEPESSTRTTAEAAGTPTFKALESRQKFFLAMLKDILTIVATRAGKTGAITVTAADISEKDNAALALATSQIVSSFGQLWANGFISADEYLRVVYRFAGEVLPAARPDNPKPQANATPPTGSKSIPGDPHLKIDAETGDVKVKEPKS